MNFLQEFWRLPKNRGNISDTDLAEIVANAFPILPCIGGFSDSLATRQEASVNWQLGEPLLQIHSLISHLPSDGELYPIMKALSEEFQGQNVPAHDEQENTFWEYNFSHFLMAYNREQKAQQGVIYTPPTIVRFLFDGVDTILREKFNFCGGISAPNVRVLDPAAGLMNFPCGYLEYLFTRQGEMVTSPLEGTFTAWEILPAQVILGQLRLYQYIQQFNELGLSVSKDNFIIAWRNALDRPPKEFLPLDGVTMPVVLGNPPYNVSSKNKGTWIQELMEDYKKGLQRAGTKRISVSRLQDDYAKFFRFASG